MLINGAPLFVGDRGSQYGWVGRATTSLSVSSRAFRCKAGLILNTALVSRMLEALVWAPAGLTFLPMFEFGFIETNE